MATKQVLFRLLEDDPEKLRRVREHLGYSSDAATLRHLIRQAAARLGADPDPDAPPRRKSEKSG
jgi:hypothetical protein